MVDARACGGSDGGLGVVGDAKPRGFDHVEVVGAVADDEGLLGAEALLGEKGLEPTPKMDVEFAGNADAGKGAINTRFMATLYHFCPA